MPTLPYYEKIAAFLITFLFLFTLILNIYLDEGALPKSTSAPHYIVSPYIEVKIVGAVAKPGAYQVAKGTPVSEVIKMAEPLDTATLKNIKTDSKITRRRTITVKSKV